VFPITHEVRRSTGEAAWNSNVRHYVLVQVHLNDPHLEGDHIKISASRYPFPTICADKQSTDWFHAISRTLKWNERDRQKSFVVVEEESLPKAAKLKVKRSVGLKVTSSRVEEPDDEEEDELSDELEEDTYDIDDSSFEADSATVSDSQPIGDEFVGREKSPSGRHVTSPMRRSKSRSRSRLRTFASGFVSPGRFASTLAHTPTVAPRHVEFNIPSSPSTDESPLQSSQSDEAQYGARDNIRSPEPPSAKSRIPKDRELGFGTVKTPIPIMHGRPPGQHHEHRAFAVWGHDESDSNASDSEA
jgi:NAD+ kinase